MSTKIFNVYEVKDFKNIQRITHRFRKLYNEYCFQTLLNLQERQVETLLSSMWKNRKDLEKILKKPLKELESYPLSELLEKIKTVGFHSPINFSASVVVYYHRNRFFIQFFGLDYINKIKLAIQNLIKNETFKDYHYQNQTDQPKDISDKEWNERRKTWDIIFKNSDKFSSVGFVNAFDNELFKLAFNFRQEILKSVNS
jgi:hypothetical protein